MKVRVDKEACVSCGACVEACPDVFQFGEDGKAEVVTDDYGDCDVRGVAEECPTGAIIVEE